MKRFNTIVAIMMLMALMAGNAQDAKTIPSVTVKNIGGEAVDTKTFSNDGKPFVINFWATWCKPCIQELNSIHDVYEDWQAQTGVKIYAVSIDDSRSSRKVAPFINGRGWKYEVILDENSDLKRAMGVNNPPHTFLYNGKGELVWQHNGYAPGDEEELLQQIKNLTVGGGK
jgi:thiol-disulfide isomerase/thioredoxin